MRIPRIGFTLALAMCAANVANAAPPAAPQVTMGADIKLLRFDWEPVAGAAYYQLRFRPSVGAAYQPLGERIPASITQTEQSHPRAPAGLGGHAIHRLRLQQRRLHELRGAQPAQPDARHDRISQGLEHRARGRLRPERRTECRRLHAGGERSVRVQQRELASTAIRQTTFRGTPAPFTCFVAAATPGSRRPTSRPARISPNSVSVSASTSTFAARP